MVCYVVKILKFRIHKLFFKLQGQIIKRKTKYIQKIISDFLNFSIFLVPSIFFQKLEDFQEIRKLKNPKRYNKNLPLNFLLGKNFEFCLNFNIFCKHP